MNRVDELQALVSVVEAGGFSKAAARLGVAKSVVSRRLRALESRLGVQLLQRTTRTRSLTGPGRQLYERAVRILADLEEAEQLIADANAALSGRIRLAAPLSFGLHHLDSLLADFMRQHPGIDLDLDLNDRQVDLVEEGFDMAVRIGELSDSTLLARRLGSARLVTCASPAYLKQHGTPQHPDQLRRHVGLQYSNASPGQAWQFASPAGEVLVSVPDIRMRANNGDALATAATAGLGVIHTPRFLVEKLLATGKLITVLAGYERPPLGIYAVYPPGRLLPRRIETLTAFLAQRLTSPDGTGATRLSPPAAG